jgi:hypothetical protein
MRLHAIYDGSGCVRESVAVVVRRERGKRHDDRKTLGFKHCFLSLLFANRERERERQKEK